jgi:hypothetical protein
MERSSETLSLMVCLCPVAARLGACSVPYSTLATEIFTEQPFANGCKCKMINNGNSHLRYGIKITEFVIYPSVIVKESAENLIKC